ncbi:LINE-1 type transposase domain-containing 1 [Labeo rohita]|uniref:LINE-1 type transposase domain-containing 1 n=1 Tax=Labeo rohita TaxID=84645 RepID=A0A498MA55_LABRO|nr:LINE-1 type transposase domain-containing 1 [Labeo rohita]RXN14027.1 LINE-1 type transposase domain-containing 1 [Labeo rohita]
MASVNLSASIAAIHADIKAFRVDIKTELTAFRDSFTKDVKEELSSFKQDVNQKLNGLVTDLNVTAERIDEAERRVAELEEGAAESREMLGQSIQMQEHLQERLLDLETRSRRNNIRIFGVPEGSEGNNVKDLVESIIKTELSLSDLDLKIQRCHRALGPKPPADAYPRSVVVFFLEYRTKDLVLRSAWMKKEVHWNGKRIFFDQDYPPEIQQKRKKFAPIRKILKEKDLKEKGLMSSEEAAGIEPSGKVKQRPWEVAGAISKKSKDAQRAKIREKLRGFQRDNTSSDGMNE